MKRRKKNDEVDNQIRCVASDCIIRLFESGNVSQLELLKMHVDRAIEELTAQDLGDES